jgi:mannitol/fructose-specific phosphotransferase system IIA component (Ntr-type)
MRLTDYIDPKLVITDLEVDSSADLFSKLVEEVHKIYPNINKDELLQKVQDRESVAHTGLECGIGVPHAMIAGIDKTICLVARLTQDLDMGARDGQGVSLIFFLISPATKITAHIKILARLARLCSLQPFLKNMRQAKDAQTLYEVIAEEDGRHV